MCILEGGPSLTVQELQTLNVAFPLNNTLFLQLLINPLGDFNPFTWQRRSCVYK
jgi:hypothetical protein